VEQKENHENGKKQFIYPMNIKSNGKSLFKGGWGSVLPQGGIAGGNIEAQ
jgi:hypothetical protein